MEASYISTHKVEDVNLQGNSYIYVSSQEGNDARAGGSLSQYDAFISLIP